MTTVEIRRPSRELRQAMAEIRTWVGQRQVQLRLFEVGFLREREVLFRLHFPDETGAAAFRREIGGVLVDEAYVKLAA